MGDTAYELTDAETAALYKERTARARQTRGRGRCPHHPRDGRRPVHLLAHDGEVVSAQAITGGPPPEGNWFQRLERRMRETPALDPRTTGGVILYTVLGLAIGFLLGSM